MLEAISIRTQRWAWVRLDHLSTRFGHRREEAAHLQVGERGEQEGFFHLRSLGFNVVARRWSSGRLRGDLDLVAWDKGTLCFVEVKTRSQRDPLEPAESAVDLGKRRLLRRLAAAYLRQFPEEHRADVPVRFDILSVYLPSKETPWAEPEFELHQNAFPRREALTGN